MAEVHTLEVEVGGKKIIIETGKLAKQAGGSVTVRCGGSVVLAVATGARQPKPDPAFFPLTVEYVEKTFAAGKIPGGFFKREGRPTEQATLVSRFIDRPIRPLFADGYMNETQVIVTVLSSDPENATDVLAMVGASAALTLSPLPFMGPIAGVNVGRINGKLVVNPTAEEMEESDIDLVVAGSRDAIVMVEGGSNHVSEGEIVEAIMFAHKEMQPLIDAQLKLQKLCGQEKWEVIPVADHSEMENAIKKEFGSKIREAVTIREKQARHSAIDELKAAIVEKMVPADSEEANTLEKIVSAAYSNCKKDIVREMIANDKKRIDGRGVADIRQITSEVGLLPRTHGSGLFTRGETQVLAVVTLGTEDDRQIIDALEGEYTKRFMLHYNFPPFSVGEVKPLRSPGRREIGHGALAERAIAPVLPSEDDFPYTIRLVSEVLESNGSSSMATVCSGILALMDAGVPISTPVAGIAMGLIREGEKYAILSDILGDEDHLGDMDFKVTGSAKGVTALQMDIKITGITEAILKEALEQARVGRLHILSKMNEALTAPRESISMYAPKITILHIPKDKIGELIGPGGKNIRGIIEQTGAKIDIDDDGTVHVASADGEASELAIKMIKRCTAVPEIGKYYHGVVQKVMEFGAFVEILPGVDGLVHVSQLANERVNNVHDYVREGDEFVVKVLEVDPSNGRIRLSRKEAIDYTGEITEA